MKKVLFVLLFISGPLCVLNAQTEVSRLQQKFRSFDYDGVIELANELLTRSDQFSTDELVNIYEMKAMSHYSQSDLEEAEYAFISLLKIDPNYEPDPINTSPKIITFFNSIKKDVESQSRKSSEPVEQLVVQDTVMIMQQRLGEYQKSIPASLVVPGAGHLFMGDKKRGFILTSLSVLSLSSAVYYSHQTRIKQDQYLSAVEDAEIASSYSAYNQAYKRRNALWAAFAAVWVYSQADLIFWHQGRVQAQLAAYPSILPQEPSYLSLSITF